MAWVVVGGATGSLVGLRPRLDVLALQTAWFLGFSVAALSWQRVSRRPRRLGLPVVIGALVALAGGVPLLASDPDSYRTERTEPVCRGEAPQVCTHPSHVRMAGAVHDVIAPYVQVLREQGVPEIPERFVERVPGVRHGPTEGGFSPIDPLQMRSGEVDRGSLLGNIFSPPCREPERIEDLRRVGDAQSLLTVWLADLTQGGLDVSDDHPTVAAFRRLPSDARTAWTRETYLQLRRCRFDAIRLPVPGSATAW